VLIAGGRSTEARPEVEAALGAFRQLGARTEMARAEAMLERLDPADLASLPEVSVGPLDSLSRREREVLALVAEGLTNHEIAGRLTLSEHTVHRHVTNILRKLRLPSRAAAASLAVRHGLA
jgi:DNA-binding NarL/FixJ family response regulator